MTSSISRPVRERSERPSAETTPAVTVDSKPSGLPIATTSWPRRSLLELPSRAAGSETSSMTRSRARSVCGSSPSTRALTVRVSAKRQPHGGGALHDVAVGQHQAVGRDHHARAGAAALALLAVGRRLDPHDRGPDPVDDVDHGLRIGVEQRLIVWGWFRSGNLRRPTDPARRRRARDGSRTWPLYGDCRGRHQNSEKYSRCSQSLTSSSKRSISACFSLM